MNENDKKSPHEVWRDEAYKLLKECLVLLANPYTTLDEMRDWERRHQELLARRIA